MKLTLKQAQAKFPAGTRVRYAKDFLRSIADYSRESAQRTGTIQPDPIQTYGPTFHIIKIQWDGETEIGSVNCSNLVPENRLHLEPA